MKETQQIITITKHVYNNKKKSRTIKVRESNQRMMKQIKKEKNETTNTQHKNKKKHRNKQYIDTQTT